MHPSTQADGDDRRLRGGRVRRHRFGQLWRPARAWQHPRRARGRTVEAEPRVIELRGDAAQKINRAYGTTGIITALEMPLAPLLALDRRGRCLRRFHGAASNSASRPRWPTASSRNCCRRSPGTAAVLFRRAETVVPWRARAS